MSYKYAQLVPCQILDKAYLIVTKTSHQHNDPRVNIANYQSDSHNGYYYDLIYGPIENVNSLLFRLAPLAYIQHHQPKFMTLIDPTAYLNFLDYHRENATRIYREGQHHSHRSLTYFRPEETPQYLTADNFKNQIDHRYLQQPILELQSELSDLTQQVFTAKKAPESTQQLVNIEVAKVTQQPGKLTNYEQLAYLQERLRYWQHRDHRHRQLQSLFDQITWDEDADNHHGNARTFLTEPMINQKPPVTHIPQMAPNGNYRYVSAQDGRYFRVPWPSI